MPLSSATHNPQESNDKTLPKIALEGRQFRDISESKLGGNIELYFEAVDKIGTFSVIINPSDFSDQLYCLTTNKEKTKFFFRPMTKEMHAQNRNSKVFQLIEIDGASINMGKSATPKDTTKKTKNQLGRVLGTVAIVGSLIGATALLMSKKNNDPNSEKSHETSFSSHYSIAHPIPGATFYEKLEVKRGQNLEQLSGEYLISIKYLYDLNPQLNGKIIDGIIDEDVSIIVPRAREIFQLQEPLSWNQIAEKYSVDPFILMKINGPEIKMGDIIMIPTEAQAQDILHYLSGEDIESVLYELEKAPASLEEIALYMNIPHHLHELFYEMNLSSEEDKSPAAIHSKSQKLKIGAKFIIPTIRDFSRDILTNMHKLHRAYDIHRAGQNESLASLAVYYGIPLETMQKLNPNIDSEGILQPNTLVKTRDTSNVIQKVCAQVVLPQNAIAFVAEREMGNKKEGYLRPGISQMHTVEIERTIKSKGKKPRTVKEKKEMLRFPNDCITLEPGCDLGQIEEGILRYALDTIVEPAIIERIVLLSKTAQAYKKTKGEDGKYPTHALKEIPPEFNDIADFKLTEKQTNDMKLRIMQAYWDIYLKKHVPNIDKPGFITDEMKAVLLSIIYHRGGYHFSKAELKLMNEGKWDDPIILEAIKRGKSGTEGRTNEEIEMFKSGLLNMSVLSR